MTHSLNETYNTVGVDKETTIGVILGRMNTSGLEAAIEKAGGQEKLAKLLGVGQSHISNWKNRNKRIPAERVLDGTSYRCAPGIDCVLIFTPFEDA